MACLEQELQLLPFYSLGNWGAVCLSTMTNTGLGFMDCLEDRTQSNISIIAMVWPVCLVRTFFWSAPGLFPISIWKWGGGVQAQGAAVAHRWEAWAHLGQQATFPHFKRPLHHLSERLCKVQPRCILPTMQGFDKIAFDLVSNLPKRELSVSLICRIWGSCLGYGGEWRPLNT